jgi:hypothetical protein
LFIFVSGGGIQVDFIELTIGHIIIQTANGELTAQRDTSEIAIIIANNLSGELSCSIYQIATLKQMVTQPLPMRL